MRNTLLALLSALLLAAAPAKDPVTVNKGEPRVQTRTFNPSNPPSDMPPLSDDEAAVTHSSFSSSVGVEVVVLGDVTRNGKTVSRIRVDSVTTNVGLSITLWLPEKAGKRLIEHEEAHQRISELFYKDADKVMRQAAQQQVGQIVLGEGATTQAARQAAMDKVIHNVGAAYMTQTQIPAARVNEIFDDITDHGRKNIPVDTAIERSMAQWRREQQTQRGSGSAPAGRK